MNPTVTKPENQSFSNDYDPKEQNNPDVTKLFSFQISWPEEIEMSSSLQRPQQVVTSDDVDTARDKKHPIMLKLGKCIHKAQVCHKTPFQILTSKSRQVLYITILCKN